MTESTKFPANIPATLPTSNRRASLPSGKVSVVVVPETSTPSKKENKSSIFTQSRRASTGMFLGKDQHDRVPKEVARWRPATTRAQQEQKTDEVDSSRPHSESTIESKNKTIQQKIFEKTAVSLSLGLFVVICAWTLGLIPKVIVKRDLGIAGLWIHQLLNIILFCFDKRVGDSTMIEQKRMDNFKAFEILTLVCQILPIIWTWILGSPSTYTGICMMILFQAVFKFLLMTFFQLVVEITF